jgi:hypothetical protein
LKPEFRVPQIRVFLHAAPVETEMGAVVKEQYVGDINDYRKYALLRAFAASGDTRIGVSWMLTPSDGSSDGSKRAYLNQPEKYRHHDPELFDVMAGVRGDPDRRRLQHIEESGAVPGASYFNEPLSDNASERRAYMEACRTALADVDLVFFDPDNGLEVKKPRIGQKGSSKFLFEEELKAIHENGQSALVYQHFPFIKKDVFIASCIERLRAIAPSAVIGTFRTAHVVFLLLIHPRSPSRITDAAREATSRWDPKFIVGALFEPADKMPALAAGESGGVAAVDETTEPQSAPVSASPADKVPPGRRRAAKARPRTPAPVAAPSPGRPLPVIVAGILAVLFWRFLENASETSPCHCGVHSAHPHRLSDRRGGGDRRCCRRLHRGRIRPRDAVPRLLHEPAKALRSAPGTGTPPAAGRARAAPNG